MIKQRVNELLIFLLLATFLVVKWAPAHAHLNVQHNHGDEQHQHSVETHAHQPTLLHTAPIDSHHPQIEEARIIDLGHDQAQSNSERPYHPVALAAFPYFRSLAQAKEMGLSKNSNFLPRLLHQHPGQPRAVSQLVMEGVR